MLTERLWRVFWFGRHVQTLNSCRLISRPLSLYCSVPILPARPHSLRWEGRQVSLSRSEGSRPKEGTVKGSEGRKNEEMNGEVFCLFVCYFVCFVLFVSCSWINKAEHVIVAAIFYSTRPQSNLLKLKSQQGKTTRVCVFVCWLIDDTSRLASDRKWSLLFVFPRTKSVADILAQCCLITTLFVAPAWCKLFCHRSIKLISISHRMREELIASAWGQHFPLQWI